MYQFFFVEKELDDQEEIVQRLIREHPIVSARLDEYYKLKYQNMMEEPTIRYDDLFRILEAMGQMFDFCREKVDPALVSNFVDRIVMKDNHTFAWMISLEGDAKYTMEI